jgi:hypothetical protein
MIWFLTTQRKIRSACLQNSIISHQREFSEKKNIDYNITEKRQIITSQGKKIDYNNVTEKKTKITTSQKKTDYNIRIHKTTLKVTETQDTVIRKPLR